MAMGTMIAIDNFDIASFCGAGIGFLLYVSLSLEPLWESLGSMDKGRNIKILSARVRTILLAMTSVLYVVVMIVFSFVELDGLWGLRLATWGLLSVPLWATANAFIDTLEEREIGDARLLATVRLTVKYLFSATVLASIFFFLGFGLQLFVGFPFP